MEKKFKEYDFSGWATYNDVRCSDGKTIRQNAFIEDDGKVVPIVWNHQHNDIENVLGHALLENRQKGVYFYAKLNDTPKGKIAKQLIHSGDISQVSIYANGLKQERGNVTHGVIRELSMVLAGANPYATIEYPIVAHGDDFEEIYDEAIIHNALKLDNEGGELDTEYTIDDDEIAHAETSEETSKSEGSGKTVEQIYNTLNADQKALFTFMIAKASEGEAKSDDDDKDDDKGGTDVVKHNAFDTTQDRRDDNVLSQSAIREIFETAKSQNMKLSRSFKDYIESNGLAHADGDQGGYGIEGIEWLFPEARELNTPPSFIKREPSDWVNVVMNGVHHTPFSRVKTTFANITEDEARAKGYVKGNQKTDEVFSLLRRVTEPQTVYKRQKLDRDDIIDITDFDVVSWIKGEMRMMLDEEIARAILIGDGRSNVSPDKIKEDHVRPIANDADLFTIKVAVRTPENADDATKAKAFIRAAIKARKGYRGKGRPRLFTATDYVTEMLLLEDNIGRSLYETETQLATKLRVSGITEVSVMEGARIGNCPLMGIIVNLQDYNVGADKGGAISLFDDFDIDFNQYIYLIETRISGALVTPYSAIVLFDGDVPTSVDGGVTYSKVTTSEDSGN